jgi:uncharacterized protein
MILDAAGFDWDAGNAAKCEKHGLSRGEIEQIFRRSPLVVLDRGDHGEVRLNAIGISPAGRHVFIVFSIRQRGGRSLLRPISARYMHEKEVRAYERRTAAQAISESRDR